MRKISFFLSFALTVCLQPLCMGGDEGVLSAASLHMENETAVEQTAVEERAVEEFLTGNLWYLRANTALLSGSVGT